MKMGKKVREYKSGDFIFAKVKGYPAWPARVQRLNGKKYFVYFYGTGETANLPPNMIFDYAENKDKFLTKTVKRRDFNDGVKQIEYDFANNVPLEQVVGALAEAAPDANTTANESTSNDTIDDTGVDTTAADETMADDANTTQNDTAVEDSDDTGTLVIDEGKKGRKSTAKTPAKEPIKAKEPKTPRGKAKKEEAKEEEGDKKEEEIVSRSGRKIRPKRYIDEQTEENATLPSPSPAPKKRRAASPQEEKKEKEKEKSEPKEKGPDKTMKHFNTVTQSELADIKEPFKSDDAEKENILIAYLPSGQYVGIKLFQSRPTTFKNEAARLQWDKQSATNAITLKQQLERSQITTQSVISQLVTDLNLTDEEKATLDKERETEEKKSRVQFLKAEMKLIELDTKIKTCLCLEKADTDLCLKLLDELMELEVRPLMLLKHPSSLETVKRLRAYVGNTPSWDLSEDAAILFAKQAHRIRKQADVLYRAMKDLFTTPDGLSFWEYFSERVLHFKKVTSKLTSDELLEMVHEPIEMSQPTSHTMKASIEAANEETPLQEEDDAQKKKVSPAKEKKPVQNNTQKTPLKRQSSRKQQEEKDNNKETETNKQTEEESAENQEKSTETEVNKDDNKEKENNKDVKSNNKEVKGNKNKEVKENNKEAKDKEVKDTNKDVTDKEVKDNNKEVKDNTKDAKDKEDKESQDDKQERSKESSEQMEVDKETSESTEKSSKETGDKEEKDKQEGEPRAKRMRESKKTEAPPSRSPAKRKAKS